MPASKRAAEDADIDNSVVKRVKKGVTVTTVQLNDERLT
jgi:hypothetical protein